MIDETTTPETDNKLTLPDFLDRASPEVKAIVEAGQTLTLEQRKAELAKATATTFVAPEPKAKSATAMAAKPAAPAPTPAKVAKPKPAKVVGGKKSDAEMIALINEHREAAGGTAGKTLKALRALDISCSQERFKKLYAKA